MSFLNRLKVKNVFYTGNLKLIKSDIKTNLENQNSKLLKELNFWCGVSTHNGEENFCLQTHLELKKTNEKIITIIAPRHINRIDQIIKLCREKNLSYQVLDKEDLLNKNKEIILINSFGILPYFLKYSKSVFIGKSTIKKLESDSGQNPIEAAQLGCFIYHGEYIYNFKEIYEILEKNEISKKINNFNELSKNILIDFNKPSKNINQFSDLMKSLSEKTLSSYKHYINNLLVNENI